MYVFTADCSVARPLCNLINVNDHISLTWILNRLRLYILICDKGLTPTVLLKKTSMRTRQVLRGLQLGVRLRRSAIASARLGYS